MIIGAGPIVIGQACEFDYSGTQACKALRAEGYEVVLINSNPATIMTDPETADHTYVGPMTLDMLEDIIRKEKPDAILPTMGGQTGLNLAKGLAESGKLEQYGVELIGAKLDSINVAEDRLLFKNAMAEIGLKTPPSGTATTMEEAIKLAEEVRREEGIEQKRGWQGLPCGRGCRWEENWWKRRSLRPMPSAPVPMAPRRVGQPGRSQ